MKDRKTIREQEMKKILVICGHPGEKSLNGSLAESYIKKSKKNNEVKSIFISELKFDPILHEGYKVIQKLEPDLVEAQKKIKWAEHVVFFFPIWWGATPALMKGFMERVFLPGFAFRFAQNKIFPEKRLLKGKTARVITTSGGPWWIYLLTFFPYKYMFNNFFLRYCGFGKIRNNSFFGIETKSEEGIKSIFRKIEKLGEKGK